MASSPWSESIYDRNQLQLFSPSLDEMIASDHKIRSFETLLNSLNWESWEREYNLTRGQPPIHPMYLSGLIIYGLLERIRSSRDLEKASRMRIDFMWFLSGRSIDHSTISSFRTKFKSNLDDLFKQIALISLTGSTEINLSIDGTRIRSNNSVHKSLTAESLKVRVHEISTQLSEALEEMATQDCLDDPDSASKSDIEVTLHALEQKHSKLRSALKEVTNRDSKKFNRKGRAPKSKIPLTDQDSYILKNKEGGFAPNYTPVAAVDVETGTILSAQVPVASSEESTVMPAVDDIQNFTKMKPEKILFDKSFASGKNLHELDKYGIESYSSAGKTNSNNPAERKLLAEPVNTSLWDQLPSTKTGKILTEAFIYDQGNDCYWCPMGKKLELFCKTKRKEKTGIKRYRYTSCEGCPLQKRCISGKNANRTITCDKYSESRLNLVKRMAQKTAPSIYSKRAPVSEGVFAQIKGSMGIRKFLTRGMKKVRTEWLWICTAYNINKLLSRN